MNSNAQKLAIAIALLKDKKCACGISHKQECMPLISMPIVEIDGVKNISCYIKFYCEKKGLAFEVEADFKYDGENDESPTIYMKRKYNTNGINKDDILAFSCELLEELPQIRLGLNGQLLIRDTQIMSMRAAFEDVFATIECETIKVDKTGVCCVCYEKTDTKTPCGHTLCNRCWCKIEKDEKDEDAPMPCPLCRKNIFYI
jgi:hypothetical protein